VIPARALVRSLPATFLDATVAARPAAPIELAVARAQHDGYVSALASLGPRVTVLPADDALPDCCFVEDTAVVADGIALITTPGAPSRRGEPRAVRDALAPLLEIAEVGAAGTLDGGDVLRIGRRMYVGRSARTDAGGARRLREVFGARGYDVREVSIGALLHLKCACSSLDGDDVLVAEGALPPSVFEGLRVVQAPAAEAYAANCVAIGRRVLMAAGFPGTARALRAAGYEPTELPVTEFRKADGSLTCLSLLF
jgi:dimethylargininase